MTSELSASQAAATVELLGRAWWTMAASTLAKLSSVRHWREDPGTRTATGAAAGSHYVAGLSSVFGCP